MEYIANLPHSALIGRQCCMFWEESAEGEKDEILQKITKYLHFGNGQDRQGAQAPQDAAGSSPCFPSCMRICDVGGTYLLVSVSGLRISTTLCSLPPSQKGMRTTMNT
jgi:threonine dehydrogenase-like Zn-dependent dehydrogenase